MEKKERKLNWGKILTIAVLLIMGSGVGNILASLIPVVDETKVQMPNFYGNNYFLGDSLANVTDILAYPQLGNSYVIWKTGSTYYSKNGTTGAVTSSSGDFGTFLNAVAATLTSGGVIQLRTGSYSYANTIKIPTRVSLVGEDKYATKLTYTGVGGYALEGLTKMTATMAGIQIKKLEIQVDDASSGGIDFKSVSYGLIEDVYLHNDAGNATWSTDTTRIGLRFHDGPYSTGHYFQCYFNEVRNTNIFGWHKGILFDGYTAVEDGTGETFSNNNIVIGGCVNDNYVCVDFRRGNCNVLYGTSMEQWDPGTWVVWVGENHNSWIGGGAGGVTYNNVIKFTANNTTFFVNDVYRNANQWVPDTTGVTGCRLLWNEPYNNEFNQGKMISYADAYGDPIVNGYVDGYTEVGISISAGGKIYWGDGTNPVDSSLERVGADHMSFSNGTVSAGDYWATEGDFWANIAGKGIVLKNQFGNVTKRVRLNDAGDGLVFEDP